VADGWGLSTEPIPNLYGEPTGAVAENPNGINELPEIAAELGPSIEAGGRRRVSPEWRGAMWKYHIAAVR